MLTAVAYVLLQATATTSPRPRVVVAVLASLMVTYTRARAEALGVECKVGIANRAVRVVILSAGLLLGRPRLGCSSRPSTSWPASAPSRSSSASSTCARPARRGRRCNRRAAESAQHHSEKESPPSDASATAPRATRGQGPRRDHRRRQLRELVRAGRLPLQGRRRRRSDVPGLMHVDLGGYHVRDIEFTCAFDIDATRSARTSARPSGPTRTTRSASPTVPAKMGVPVHRGMTHDGLGKYLKEKITKAAGETADIVQILKDTHTDVVVSYLPVGSEQATKWYVEQVLEAGCAFVNCIPVFIAREDYWDKRFEKAGLPIIGDDIKSPGRRDDRPPLAGPAVPRARREDAAHVAAQRRRQHGLLQHARARAPGVQEDLQDERRDVDHGPRAARRRRLHRPLGLRAVADGPQVGPHPPRGAGLRRRAADGRDEARGLGLAELRRHRHRRRAPAASSR